MSKHRRFDVAIVGTGGIAAAHAAGFHMLADRVQVVAAVDVNADRLATFGHDWSIPRLYPDLNSMLVDERPDLVNVCTPPGLHEEQARACLEHGITVLCEKPPALSLAELDRIIAAEATGSAHFATVFQNRFGAAPRAIGRLLGDPVASAKLGRPMNAVCHTLWYRPDEYFAVPWRGWWDLEGGGPTIGHGIHQIDLLLALLGDWHEVVAVAARQARPVATEDISCAIVTLANGAVATVVNSLVSPRETSYLRFDFEHATIDLAPSHGYGDWEWTLTAAPGHDDVAPAAEVEAPEQRLVGHPAQISAVLDALEAGTRPPVASTGARATLELISAIYASAFTGRRITRGEISRGSPFYDRMDGTGAPWATLRSETDEREARLV